MVVNISNPDKHSLVRLGSVLSSLSKGYCEHKPTKDLYSKTKVPILLLYPSEYKIYTATGRPMLRIKSILGDYALYLSMSMTKVHETKNKLCCLYFEKHILKAAFGIDIPSVLRSIGQIVPIDVYASAYIEKSDHRLFFNHLSLCNKIQRNFIQSMSSGDSIRNDPTSFIKYAETCASTFKQCKTKPRLPLTSLLFLYNEIVRDPNDWPNNKSKFIMAGRIEVGERSGSLVPIKIVSKTLTLSFDVKAPIHLQSQADLLITISYVGGKCKLIVERYVKTDQEDLIKILKEHI